MQDQGYRTIARVIRLPLGWRVVARRVHHVSANRRARLYRTALLILSAVLLVVLIL